MAKTESAKKANRQSNTKRLHNQMWKKKIKLTIKSVKALAETTPQNTDILNQELSKLQKVLDKAVKKQVIHQNKANRIKSAYAKRTTVQTKVSAKESSPKRGKSVKSKS